MTEESVAIGLAESASERVRLFMGAAEARLADLRSVLGKDEALEEELASAVTLLLREGVSTVLDDREGSAEERSMARRLAREGAERQISALAGLSTSARGRVKEAVGQALKVSQELAKR
jgi:hypothetical protein